MLLPQTMTEEEYDVWCQDPDTPRSEFVDGRVEILGGESTGHEDVRTFVHTLLRHYVRRKGLGKVHGPNLESRLRPGLRRLPDILFIAAEHLPRLTDVRIEGAPDLAMEIVSRKSSKRDRKAKYAEYAAAGISEYWIIDPRLRSVELYVLRDGGYERRHAVEGVYHSETVPGFFLREAWLWQDPQPNELDLLPELGIR